MKILAVCVLLLLIPLMAAHAGEADVIKAEIEKLGDGTYRFDVTVSHSDDGWDHYADKWDVLGPDGTTLGTRTLYHPHVDEQPFTRNLSGVKVLEGTSSVTIRAHDSIHEYGGKVLTVDLP